MTQIALLKELKISINELKSLLLLKEINFDSFLKKLNNIRTDELADEYRITIDLFLENMVTNSVSVIFSLLNNLSFLLDLFINSLTITVDDDKNWFTSKYIDVKIN